MNAKLILAQISRASSKKLYIRGGIDAILQMTWWEGKVVPLAVLLLLLQDC